MNPDHHVTRCCVVQCCTRVAFPLIVQQVAAGGKQSINDAMKNVQSIIAQCLDRRRKDCNMVVCEGSLTDAFVEHPECEFIHMFFRSTAG